MTRPTALSSIRARNHLAEALRQMVSRERRSRVRFPLELRVRYRTLGRGQACAGVGLLVNISSGGMLVAHPHEISEGTRIELNMEWPSLLDGRIPLQLVMEGKVVRARLSDFAVELSRHQFRTTRRTVIPIHRALDDNHTVARA